MLKTMLCTYCLSSGKDWALPFLMSAIQEAEQESHGFSPVDLLLGHTVNPTECTFMKTEIEDMLQHGLAQHKVLGVPPVC